MTWARLLAGVITALAALLIAGAVGLLVAASYPPSSVQYLAVSLVLSLPSLALGWVVLRKEPRNLVGTTICLFGLLPLMTLFTDSYAVVVAARPGLLPVSDVLVTLQPGSWMVLYVPAALLLLLFPTGRLPSRRWRPVVVGLFVVPVLFDLAAGMASEPFEEPFVDSRHVLGILDDTVLIVVVLPLLLGLMALLVLSAVSMIVRYRGTTDVKQRAQLKWLALGAAAVPGTLLLCWASYLLLDRADVVVVGLAATAVIIPAATAVAIVKYDLFDVDRAVSTAVTYGLVSAALLAVFTALMMLVGTSVGGSSTFAAAAATAICAAVLMPLRTRIQRRVDRRLYPLRQRTFAAIGDLRDRTHAGLAEPEELQGVLRAALGEPVLTVGYRLPGRPDLGSELVVDARGNPVEIAAGRRAPVELGGITIGELSGATRTTVELLAEVATASALLVEVVRLRVEVLIALRDVESSRARLQRVGYQERERLERDLHDGAQQRLVALGMAVRLSQRHLRDGTVDVDGLLDQTVAEIATAVAELRRIAHGLRPSCLDDGLGPALVSLASGTPIPIELDVRADEIPDDVATTAYFVASEAVTNAVKHAGANRIDLHVAHADGGLTVRIRDDGRGGADLLHGTGLTGMVDRVAAAGGSLSLTSPQGAGTVIEAVLPCAS